MTGNFDGTLDFGAGTMTATGGGDLFLAKLNAAGSGVWSQHFGDATSDNVGDGYQEVAVDTAGDPTISGAYLGNMVSFGGGDLPGCAMCGAYPFVAKFDAARGYAWAYMGNNLGSASSLATDVSDDFFVAGGFTTPLSFAGASLSSPQNTFVIKLTR